MQDRAYRIAQEQRIIKKRLKLVKKVSTKTHYEQVVEKKGRLSKQHPMDCGNPKCLLCHAEKVFDKKKPADRRREQYIEEDDYET